MINTYRKKLKQAWTQAEITQISKQAIKVLTAEDFGKLLLDIADRRKEVG